MNDTRRVLIAAWWLDAIGGMERYLTELALALKEQNVDVVVAVEMPVSHHNQYRMALERGGIPLLTPPAPAAWSTRLGAKAGPRIRGTARLVQSTMLRLQKRSGALSSSDADLLISSAGSSVLSARFLRTLRRECNRSRPDVIHVIGSRAAHAWVCRWARSQGIASVYWESMDLTENGGPMTPETPAILQQYADVITAPSRASARSLERWLPSARTVTVNSHIVRDSALATDSERRYDLVTVARLAHHKGLDVLIDALAQLPANVTLAIAGEGPERAALLAQAAKLEMTERLSLPGNLSEHDVRALLHSARIFVLPSRTEGLSVAMLEAMAHGLPVVATDVGGAGEVVRDGVNGFLVPKEDAPALANAIARLLGNETLLTQMGNAARETFLKGGFDARSVALHTLAIYAEARARV